MTFDQETDFKKAAISIWSLKDPTSEAELTWLTFALLFPTVLWQPQKYWKHAHTHCTTVKNNKKNPAF